MASKSAQHEPEKAEVIEEALDHCDTTLDRVKVLYEQFFLGIQKQPPSHLHTDVERKLRELQQMQIRNTALRYRFSTIQQKFGSYNNYWRRTLRQIENGTYHRNLAKVGRQAAQSGEDIPDEILAAMPKRMREQVKRDREAALAARRRRDGDAGDDFNDEVATGTTAAQPRVAPGGAHVLDDDDGEFDLDAYFRAVTNDDSETLAASQSRRDQTESEAFSAEVPTDADLVPRGLATAKVHAPTPAAAQPAATQPAAAQPATRPSSPTMTPGHANPAVRAAVGMRLATPPAGVPLASRLAPTAGTPPSRKSQPIATQQPPQPPSQDSDVIPTMAIPTMRPTATPARDSGVIPTMAIPTMRAGLPPQRPVPGGLPSIPTPGQSGPARPTIPAPAPSQVARPLPVMPGAASNRGPVAVETLAGPFPRTQPPGASTPGQPGASQPARPGPPTPPGSSTGSTQAIPRPPAASGPGSMGPGSSGSMDASVSGSMRAGASGSMNKQPGASTTQAMKPARATTEPGVGSPSGRAGPPPGMTDADVNALYSKYVKAKEAVGEKAGPGSYGKLLQTINAQAPKIMEQYKAKGVEFQVVVKDNQVVIRAKPKP